MRISDWSSDVCSSDLTFARINEIAGDPIRAGEAWAEAAYLNGRPERALVQPNNLTKRSDLDYYARARIEARIAALTPVGLALRRQGERQHVGEGKRVSVHVGHGGRRNIKKKKRVNTRT